MATQPQSNKPDFHSEQTEMVATFSDFAVDHPKLSFAAVAKKLGVDFHKAKN